MNVDKKCYLFDLDGTLLKTEPLHAQALIACLEKFSLMDLAIQKFGEITIESIQRYFRGLSDDLLYHKVIKKLDSKITLHEFEVEKLKNLELLLDSKGLEEIQSWINPGLIEVLTQLKEKNVLMCVVSASDSLTGKRLLKSAQLTSFFSHFFFREDTYFTKPNPSPYFLALRTLKVSAEDTLIFEDGFPGVSAAMATNCDVIQMNTWAPKTDLKVSRILKSFSEF